MEYFKTCKNIPVYVSDTRRGEHILLLLHGYLETSEVWADFASLLPKSIRVISLDLPGHGLSGTAAENSMELMADVISEVLYHAKVEQATVVGHSMGGYAALALAEKYPETVEKLCLFHSTPMPDTEEKKQNRDREIALIREDRLASILNINIPNMFAAENRKRMDDSIAMITENATISTPEGIVACLEGMKNRKDMNAFLAGFDKPLLLIFGKKDKYIAEPVAREMIEQFRQADVLMLENSGHAGFLEEPEISAKKIIAFVTGQKSVEP